VFRSGCSDTHPCCRRCAVVKCHPVAKSYLRYAKFLEQHLHDIPGARAVYERAFAELPAPFANDEQLFIAFAKFEERQKQVTLYGGEEGEEGR